MKKIKIFLLSFFLQFLVLTCTTNCTAEPVISEEYNFALGVNYDQLSTDIDPRQSPDMCNCISEPIGAATHRNGTERFNSQAISSKSITSAYWVYSSTGSEASLIVTEGTNLHYSTGGTTPLFTKIASNLTDYDWKWIGNQNRAIGLGGWDNEIKSFDPISNTVTDLFESVSTSAIKIRAKHGIVVNNYLILANVMASTWNAPTDSQWTKYPSRIYYSSLLVNKTATFTALKYIDYATEDGEEITGVGSIYGVVHFFKPSKIGELSFTILDLPSAGGDWEFKELINNFGLKSPKGLANAGLNYIFPANDGIRTWNGSQQTRLQVADESRIVSDDGIKTLVNKLIRKGTYNKSVGFYYEKKNWYVFGYIDPEKFPTDKINAAIIYDFRIGQWFPLCGLKTNVFTQDRDGNAYFGESTDGYVHKFDVYYRDNDSRKEMVMDVMDSTWSWTGSALDQVNVKEGTASLKIYTTAAVIESSMTILQNFAVGEWMDKSKVTKKDKISFQVYAHNIADITSLRLDLELNNVTSAFDTYFTSYTIPVSSITEGWNKFEIPLEDFPIPEQWTSLESEELPFGNTLFYYGIRFVLNSVDISSVSIDNLRIVQATNESPVNFYRFTKLFDLQTKQEKNFGTMLLTFKKTRDVSLDIDIYNNFGARSRVEKIPSDISKELVLINNDTGTISKVNSYDFETIESTKISDSPYSFYQGLMSRDNLWLSDRLNNRIMKYKQSPFGMFVSSYGSEGSGTNQFNSIHQMARDGSSIYLVDIYNQRIKQHKETDLAYVRAFGSLGSSTNTVKLHQPTGLAIDENSIVVADEGNYRLMILSKSTMGYVSKTALDYNTFGETSLARDERFDYLFYRYGDVATDSISLYLEKRDKNSGRLIARVTVLPKNSTEKKIYGNSGDIALLGKYIYVLFNDDDDNSQTAKRYLQKRLKDDFTLIDEKIYTNKNIHSVLGDSLAFYPDSSIKQVELKSDGRYVQMKYYSDGLLDNNFILYNQTFLVSPKSQGY